VEHVDPRHRNLRNSEVDHRALRLTGGKVRDFDVDKFIRAVYSATE
jgi:hypothetical protein